MKQVLFVISEDWYFLSHRLHLAEYALANGYKVTLLTRVSAYADLIRSKGIDLVDWPIERRSKNPIKELIALLFMIRLVKRLRPDIVHSVALKPVFYSSIACRLYRVRSRIFALGGLGIMFSSTSRKAQIAQFFLKLLLKWSLSGNNSRLILQNSYDVNMLLNAGVLNDGRIRLIRGAGVDTEQFSKSTTEPDQVVILPARMLWSKGIGDFVACSKKLLHKKVIIRFVLVGEPDLENPDSVTVAQLEEWVEEGVVEWWGRCDDMPSVYAQASIVCLPTTYGEGVPKSLLEAASCELPIVAYDNPGCCEIVEDGINGIIVPANDVDALAEAIERLSTDLFLASQMGRNGRNKVLSGFSQEQVAQETLAVWREMFTE